jgi:hypothetical protein
MKLKGTTVSDSSGNGNHGTATGTTIVDGLMGKARSFNGSSIVSAGSIYPASAGSIDFWMYPTSTSIGNRPISDTGGYLYFEFSASNTFRFVMHDGSSKFSPTANITPNQWWHITGIWGNGFITLYVNGQLIGSIAAGAISNITNDVRIGGINTAYFNGLIDEVRLSQHRPYT